MGVSEEDMGVAGEGGEVLDISSAGVIIQQQQSQIRELLQQQQQLQNQASTLLAPALQVGTCDRGEGMQHTSSTGRHRIIM